MLAHLCTTPGAVELVIVNGWGPVPNSDSNTALTVLEVIQCPQGYSGCNGVSISGSQPGSRVVASLPSMSPLRIAVIGRQKLKLYFASKSAILEASTANSTSANKPAFWLKLRTGAAASCRGIGSMA